MIDEHSELTTERRKLVEEREKLNISLSEKIVTISKFESQVANLEKGNQHSNTELDKFQRENDYLTEKLKTAEAVNKRLQEGNIKLQDSVLMINITVE